VRTLKQATIETDPRIITGNVSGYCQVAS